MSEPQSNPSSDTHSRSAEEMIATESAEKSKVDTSIDSSLSNGLVAARIADDFRGRDVLLLDMRHITPITDYFVIATTTSNRQMKAMADEVDIVMKNRGNPKLGAEGEGDTVWMLRDYGDVVLHIFSQEGRELYALEDLWADAKKVDWSE